MALQQPRNYFFVFVYFLSRYDRTRWEPEDTMFTPVMKRNMIKARAHYLERL